MARTIWNYDSVKEFVESNGYILCSTREEVEINGCVKAKTKIKVWCKNKEHEPYDVTFDNFKGTSNKKGTRCEQCRRNKDIIWTREKIIDYVESNGYKFINFIEFNKYASRIEIECEKGHRTTMIFRKFREGHRCSTCNESKGEKIIGEILTKENIEFEREYKFDNCKILMYNIYESEGWM